PQREAGTQPLFFNPTLPSKSDTTAIRGFARSLSPQWNAAPAVRINRRSTGANREHESPGPVAGQGYLLVRVRLRGYFFAFLEAATHFGGVPDSTCPGRQLPP